MHVLDLWDPTWITQVHQLLSSSKEGGQAGWKDRPKAARAEAGLYQGQQAQWGGVGGIQGDGRSRRNSTRQAQPWPEPTQQLGAGAWLTSEQRV